MLKKYYQLSPRFETGPFEYYSNALAYCAIRRLKSLLLLIFILKILDYLYKKIVTVGIKGNSFKDFFISWLPFPRASLYTYYSARIISTTLLAPVFSQTRIPAACMPSIVGENRMHTSCKGAGNQDTCPRYDPLRGEPYHKSKHRY